MNFEKISISETINTFQSIEANTGLSISYDKTLIYRVGSIQNTNAKLYTQKNLLWSNEDFEMLGVIILGKDCTEKNYAQVIDKMQDISNDWMSRPLTLMGKVQVVNSLMESLFVYKLNALENMSEQLCIKVEQIIKNFLWGDKRPKIALQTLQLPRKQVGLRLFDIRNKQKALKIAWVKNIISDQYFHDCFTNCIPKSTYEHFWECNLAKKDIGKVIGKDAHHFWLQILETWCEFNHHDPQNKEKVRNQVIWLSSHIKMNNEILFNTKAIKTGMHMIADITHEEDGTFMTYR